VAVIAVLQGGNAAYPWGRFDPVEYQRRNYGRLLADDRRMLELVAGFFSSLPPRPGRRGIDMGAGSNLAPALAMLPLCERLVLVDHSARNVAWLRDELLHYGTSWDAFWEVLAGHAAYRAVGNPRAALRDRATALDGSVFDPDPNEPGFDIGTMFFCAESITADEGEFDKAVGMFLDLLAPGAPFAAAFVAGSQGYWVGDVDYPAVAVDQDDVARALTGRATGVRLTVIPARDRFRHGYDGLILATGHTAVGLETVR